jgi:hypothetical protein
MLIMFLTFVVVMAFVWIGVNVLIRMLDWLDDEKADDPYAHESVSERIGH